MADKSSIHLLILFLKTKHRDILIWTKLRQQLHIVILSLKYGEQTEISIKNS